MHSRVLLPLILFLACARGEQSVRPAGETGGTMVIALPAEPATLMPPRVRQTQEKQVVDQVFDVLAEIGSDLNTVGDDGFTPRLASSWTWSADSLSIAFSIDPRARWHDGRPVTAGDVSFSLSLFRNPLVQSQVSGALAIVDSITVSDSLTAVAWFARRSPEQFYALTYNLLVLPRHILQDADPANLDATPFARNPVGSGPFKFVRWESRSVIEVTANTDYQLGRPRLDRLIWTLNPDVNSALTKVLAGEADLLETLTPDGMAQVASSEAIRAVPFTGMTYGYLGFNMRDPQDPSKTHALFSDRNLRRAIAMSLDRAAMLANVFDSLAKPGLGPFTRTLASADTTIPQPPFDTLAADRLLDSLGWRDTNGDGVRERSGRTLRFGLMVPAPSAPRRRYAELIQAQLRLRGVQVDVEVVDVPALTPRLLGGRFDTMINAWQTDPSPAAIRNSWYSTPPAQRGANLQAWSSPAFDATLDSATAELDRQKSKELYRRAYRHVVDDVPAVWLYESRPFVALHKRIRAEGRSADTWWRYLRLWWIPATERIQRDATPATTPATG